MHVWLCNGRGEPRLHVDGRGNYTGFSGGHHRGSGHGRKESLTVLTGSCDWEEKHRVYIACCCPEQYRKGLRNVGGFQELEKEGSGFSSECPEKSLAVLTPEFLPSQSYFELLTSRIES